MFVHFIVLAEKKKKMQENKIRTWKSEVIDVNL